MIGFVHVQPQEPAAFDAAPPNETSATASVAGVPDPQVASQVPTPSFSAAHFMLLLCAAVSLLVIVRRRLYSLTSIKPRRIPVPAAALLLLMAGCMLTGRAALDMAMHALGIAPDASSPGMPSLTLREISLLQAASTLSQLGIIALAAIVWSVHLRDVLARQADLGMPETLAHAAVHPATSPMRAVGLGFSSLLLMWPLAATAGLAAGWVLTLLGSPPADVIAHTTLHRLLDAPPTVWFFVMVAIVTIAAPITEELIYRGLIQSMLLKLAIPRWPAIIITSIVFAAVHAPVVEPHALGSLFVLSLGLGTLYERSHSLLAVIALHAFFNLGNLLAAFSAAAPAA